ncbi:AAA family ATPase [Cupriavidus basilensis]|nr:AAA family ATPase [Cupriavidus basilensis]MDF3885304.1 AAA family ATPase [Cupriavidus basilensis]
MHFAIDQAKALLREGRPFVWNATHLSRQMRAKTLDLLFAYGAEVNVVYLEATEQIILSRNRKRDTTFTNAAIGRILHRWEVVSPVEAHSVTYDIGR